MLCTTTRHERMHAAREWERVFGPAFARAAADTLIQLVGSLPRPTVRDLLRHVGDDAYDLDDRDRVEVDLGDLVGQPGRGPTVAQLVEALEQLNSDAFSAVLGSDLEDFMPNQ